MDAVYARRRLSRDILPSEENCSWSGSPEEILDAAAYWEHLIAPSPEM